MSTQLLFHFTDLFTFKMNCWEGLLKGRENKGFQSLLYHLCTVLKDNISVWKTIMSSGTMT